MPKKGENIRRRKDGLWEGRYPCGLANNGRTKYVSIYAKSYAEVKEKLLVAKAMPGVPKRSTKKLFEDVLLEWLDAQALCNKPSTQVKFRNLIISHIAPSLGRMQLTQITSTRLSHFLQDKASNGRLDGRGGLSASTLNTLSLILKSTLNYAAREHYIAPFEVSLKCPEIKREAAKALSSKEQDALEQSLGCVMDSAKLGILLCLYTGLRIGEICALRWGDVDLACQLIHVQRTVQRLQTNSPLTEIKTALVVGPPKSKCSLRSIPIPSAMTEMLQAHRSNPDVYVLTGKTDKPMEPRTYQYRFGQYIAVAGVSDANFHMLRHTFATRFIERGGDPKSLSELLGHASVEITLNKYVHPSMETKRQQMERFSSISGMDSGSAA